MKRQRDLNGLSHSDVIQLMDACEQLHCATPEHSFIRHSHEVLSGVLNGMRLSAMVYRLHPFRSLERLVLTSEYERWFPQFKKYVLNRPARQHYIIAADPDIGMIRLEADNEALPFSSLCRQFHDEVMTHHQLWIGVRDGNELLNYVYACDRELSERQLDMMCRIQPQLETAWKNWKHLRSLAQELAQHKAMLAGSGQDAEQTLRLRAALEALTGRQLDVVKLVAAGCDNQQVADQLKISVLTVKKHLQAIFQALGIHHRTELAARWHQAFSTPPFMG